MQKQGPRCPSELAEYWEELEAFDRIGKVRWIGRAVTALVAVLLLGLVYVSLYGAARDERFWELVILLIVFVFNSQIASLNERVCELSAILRRHLSSLDRADG